MGSIPPQFPGYTPPVLRVVSSPGRGNLRPVRCRVRTLAAWGRLRPGGGVDAARLAGAGRRRPRRRTSGGRRRRRHLGGPPPSAPAPAATSATAARRAGRPAVRLDLQEATTIHVWTQPLHAHTEITKSATAGIYIYILFRRKDNSDEAALICVGRQFHARSAATNARSPKAGTKMSPFWILLELRMMEVAVTTSNQLFAGRMLFLLPNQQCQITEGKTSHTKHRH